MDAKKCSKCGETKTLSEYYRRKIGKDGHRGVCKSCCDVLYKYPYTPNKESAQDSKKRHYLANIDKIKARNKQWRQDNKEVLREKKRLWAQAHPRPKEKEREKHLWREYGITLEEFENIKNNQNGKCAICEKDSDKLVVDHDHKTGKVRQLLCHTCNIMLGFVDDSPALLVGMAAYLIKHKAKGINWYVFSRFGVYDAIHRLEVDNADPV